MDPVTIGVAVAALLGTKAAEEFGTQAGSEAWQAVHRLRGLVRSRLSPRATQALDRHDSEDRTGASTLVAGEVAAAADADREFRDSVQALLADARGDQRLAGIIAVAQDNAKQVNITGGRIDSITL